MLVLLALLVLCVVALGIAVDRLLVACAALRDEQVLRRFFEAKAAAQLGSIMQRRAERDEALEQVLQDVPASTCSGETPTPACVQDERPATVPPSRLARVETVRVLTLTGRAAVKVDGLGSVRSDQVPRKRTRQPQRFCTKGTKDDGARKINPRQRACPAAKGGVPCLAQPNKGNLSPSRTEASSRGCGGKPDRHDNPPAPMRPCGGVTLPHRQGVRGRVSDRRRAPKPFLDPIADREEPG